MRAVASQDSECPLSPVASTRAAWVSMSRNTAAWEPSHPQWPSATASSMPAGEVANAQASSLGSRYR